MWPEPSSSFLFKFPTSIPIDFAALLFGTLYRPSFPLFFVVVYICSFIYMAPFVQRGHFPSKSHWFTEQGGSVRPCDIYSAYLYTHRREQIVGLSSTTAEQGKSNSFLVSPLHSKNHLK
uniref:Uncharacterized protein n=1 Tax=Daphnia magna TaxID=35525 RepID=A0A0P4XK41_9CRUS